MNRWRANINYMAHLMYDESCVVVDYENISLEKNEQRIIFNSGNPIEDHSDYVKYCKNNNLLVIEGSSFSHFVMDSDDYRFVIKNGIEVLVGNK